MQNDDLIRRLQALIHQTEPTHEGIIPFTDAPKVGSEEDRSLGQKWLAEGRVGCLVVAGGQGTRLGFEGPKGMFAITSCMHKSIFQLLAEKVGAAGELAGRRLPVAFMTSQTNDLATRQHFADHQFFGLDESQVFFFKQLELPFLDAQGKPLLRPDGSMAMGPDGNGGSLEAFCEAGLAEIWRNQGIQAMTFLPIDNPLADPFDAELIGFHARWKDEVTIKAVERKSASERVGTLVQTKEGLRVVEYSELSEKDRQGHRYANISCFCFSLDFVQRVKVTQWHKAWKRVSETKDAWKFERFIFDVLPQANEVHVLVYDRAHCFAPLKNALGEDSVETVRMALLQADRKAYEAVSCLKAPSHVFEVHPKFYYPTNALIQTWRGREIGQEFYLE